MDGLEAITGKILEEAIAKALEYQDLADAKIIDINQAAKDEIQKLSEIAQIKLAEETQNINLRTQSFTLAKKSKIILSMKQKLIEEVIEQAVISLGKLSKTQKMEIYLSILESYAKENDIIIFNVEDLALGSELIKLLSVHVSINPVPGEFIGGLIISQKSIEVNMTFEMIAKQYSTRLNEIASDVLFS